jgi:hypothetical protein
MSTAYVTYCSAPKRENREPLPAIERYLSERILSVDQLARENGALFLILSGTYGLIERDAPLPYYDHLLAPEEIEPMSRLAIESLQKYGVTAIVWFTVDPNLDPFVTRYARVLEIAAAHLDLDLEVRVITAED